MSDREATTTTSGKPPVALEAAGCVPTSFREALGSRVQPVKVVTAASDMVQMMKARIEFVVLTLISSTECVQAV